MTSLLHRGNFGMAQQYFRDAAEKAPKDASAWIGLAASYDHLGRFESAIHPVRETTAILRLLIAARQSFVKALEREPGNPIILNNLELLDGSQRSIARSPDAP
jgi:Flp pilus assembly protein TadD